MTSENDCFAAWWKGEVLGDGGVEEGVEEKCVGILRCSTAAVTGERRGILFVH